MQLLISTDIICGCLENPENGAISFTDTTYDSVVEYTCNTGYTLTEGHITRRCLENGSWSGSAPTCTGENCKIILLH